MRLADPLAATLLILSLASCGKDKAPALGACRAARPLQGCCDVAVNDLR